MKKIKLSFLLIFTVVLMGACNNSLERANNVVTLIQEKVNFIVSSLTEIQSFENSLQNNFEQDITNAGNYLSYFSNDQALVLQNVSLRRDRITKIKETEQEIINLLSELETASRDTNLPVADLKQLISLIQNLDVDLQTYVTDYDQNIRLEEQTFRSIANTHTNYASFFQVFDNVNTLYETNIYNLDQVLKHFEAINRLLVDTKIKLVNLADSK